jgi:hypothetical protein
MLSAVALAGVGTGEAFLVQFVGLSRIDGFPIFRTLAEQATATNWVAGVGNALNDISTGQTQTLPYYNVIGQPLLLAGGTSYLYDVTAIVAGSPGGGVAWDVNIATQLDTFNAGATTYYCELIRALEDHIQGFAGAGPNDDEPYSGNATNGTAPYEPMRRGVGETSYYRTMGLQAFTKFVEAETFQVAAQITTEQIQDLNRQYGIDVVSMMENALVNEISQSINKHILSRAFALGWQNHVNFFNAEGTQLNLGLVNLTNALTPRFIGQANAVVNFPATLPGVQIYGATTTAFENQGTIQRRVQSKILAAGNIIAQRGRRGPGNFCVTNLQIATALQDSAQFTFYPLANTVNQNNGALYPLGTLAGMTIYVDPNMDYSDTRILCGRKGADEEPGLKFMPYLMAESIQTIAEGTMSPKIAVKSRYALVEAGFHPETQYFTLVVNMKENDFGIGGVTYWDQCTQGTIISIA